jgi:phosphoenolpyruvate carboxykinase (ATP)
MFYTDTLHACADERFKLPLHILTETSCHALFAYNMFRAGIVSGPLPEFTLIHVPSLTLIPEVDKVPGDGVIAIDLDNRIALIAGRLYGGEIWKAVFTYLCTILPLLYPGVLCVHGGVNVKQDTGFVTLFEALSGGGKTALSTDDECMQVGDDGHIITNMGVANIAGGCYAKIRGISPEREPGICNAIRYGALMENVELNELGIPNYDAGPENIRVSYPIGHIDDFWTTGVAPMPNASIILTTDMFGVFPPVSLLTPEQAIYYAGSGFTTKGAGTEISATFESTNEFGFTPTFSPWLGGPFLILNPSFIAERRMAILREHNIASYLVSTGWIGGPRASVQTGVHAHPEGRRISLATTRAIVHAIQRNELQGAETEYLSEHNLWVPKHVHGVEDRNLNPRHMWTRKKTYAENADRNLHTLPEDILRAGRPKHT